MRIGIIGAGGAGLAATWLLEQQHDVTLYEADTRLGGHAHTIDVDVQGERFGVDAGIQFFGSGPAYATFNRLLDALEVPRASYPATITLFRSRLRRHVVLPPFRNGWPVWTSLTPSAICDMIRFARFLEGVPAFLAQHDTTVTVAEYIARQRLPASFTERFLKPLLLALVRRA
jgi:predicted NAD/FAD-binding protein